MYNQVARGFARAGQGNPDEARASRYILKDYVNAKLLYCHPPPDVSEEEFNRQAEEFALRRVSKRKRAPLTRVTKNADTYIPLNDVNVGKSAPSRKARAVDESFFTTGGQSLAYRPLIQGGPRDGQSFSRGKIYPHQNIVADDGTRLDGRRARIAQVLAANGAELGGKGKKHFKGNKRVKQRSGQGYD